MGKKSKSKKGSSSSLNNLAKEQSCHQNAAPEQNYFSCFPKLIHTGQTSKNNQKMVSLSLRTEGIYRDLIFGIPNFFTPQECRAWIRFGENNGFELQFHNATQEYAHRDNGRLQWESEAVAGVLWERLRAFVPTHMGGKEASGCSNNIRLYKYVPGQRFGKHIDGSNVDQHGRQSYYTVLVYLSGGEDQGRPSPAEEEAKGGAPLDGLEESLQEPLQGGHTVFYRGSYGDKVAASVAPLQGSCLLHGHGDRCLVHEGAEVKRGVKYVLRTDVMYGPN